MTSSGVRLGVAELSRARVDDAVVRQANSEEGSGGRTTTDRDCSIGNHPGLFGGLRVRKDAGIPFCRQHLAASD